MDNLRTRRKWKFSCRPLPTTTSVIPEEKPKPCVVAFLIDPEHQTVVEIDEPPDLSSIAEIIRADVLVDLNLDQGTTLWVTDVNYIPHYGFYLERLGGDFSTRRFSKGLIVSQNQPHWSIDDVDYYVRFHDSRSGLNIPRLSCS
jgi:hypothetical protein